MGEIGPNIANILVSGSFIKNIYRNKVVERNNGLVFVLHIVLVGPTVNRKHLMLREWRLLQEYVESQVNEARGSSRIVNIKSSEISQAH